MNNTEDTSLEPQTAIETQAAIDPQASTQAAPKEKEHIQRSLKDCTDPEVLRRREQNSFKEKVNWYACYVTPQHELQVHDYLMGLEAQRVKTKRGKPKKEDLFLKVDPEKVRMECYVPLQRVKCKYSDRMVWKDKIMIPGIVFVHCSLNNRDDLFSGKIKEYVTGFMSDHNKHRPQPIPESQMDSFRQLVESEYVIQMEAPTFKVGQSVMILAGPMQGHVAELISSSDTVSKTEYQTDRQGNKILDGEGNPIPKHTIKLCVRLTDMLCAKFQLDATDVAIVPKGTKTKLPVK